MKDLIVYAGMVYRLALPTIAYIGQNPVIIDYGSPAHFLEEIYIVFLQIVDFGFGLVIIMLLWFQSSRPDSVFQAIVLALIQPAFAFIAVFVWGEDLRFFFFHGLILEVLAIFIFLGVGPFTRTKGKTDNYSLLIAAIVLMPLMMYGGYRNINLATFMMYYNSYLDYAALIGSSILIVIYYHRAFPLPEDPTQYSFSEDERFLVNPVSVGILVAALVLWWARTFLAGFF